MLSHRIYVTHSVSLLHRQIFHPGFMLDTKRFPSRSAVPHLHDFFTFSKRLHVEEIVETKRRLGSSILNLNDLIDDGVHLGDTLFGGHSSS